MNDVSMIALADIRIDGGTQPRTAIDEQVVAEYADAMRSGVTFPPLTVFFDGAEYWLADGFHRYHALKAIDAAADIDCRRGTRRDAVLFSVGANDTHGLRRTNDDKRKAVQTLLADAEWAAWSDRKIAEACAVSHPFVAGLRGLTGNVSSEKADKARKVTTKHGAETTMKIAGITAANKNRAQSPGLGSKPPAAPADDDAEAYSDQEIAEDLLAENEKLRAEIKAMSADDLKAEALKWRRIAEAAQRAQSEAMDRAAKSVEREAWSKRQLMRCGKAVGEGDPDKIAAAVEALVRKHRVAA